MVLNEPWDVLHLGYSLILEGNRYDVCGEDIASLFLQFTTFDLLTRPHFPCTNRPSSPPPHRGCIE